MYKTRSITLLIVRHGQTDYNIHGKAQGWLDVPLNTTGTSQAKNAANHLKKCPKPDAIWTSDLKRAIQTAEIIKKELGGSIPLHKEEKLRERYEGSEESSEDKEYINHIPPKKEYEPAEDFDGRLLEFLNSIPEKAHNKVIEEDIDLGISCIMIVMHCDPIQHFLKLLRDTRKIKCENDDMKKRLDDLIEQKISPENGSCTQISLEVKELADEGLESVVSGEFVKLAESSQPKV